MQKQMKNGFTLIEMIMTIVILGIVSVIGIQLIVPVFTGYTNAKATNYLYSEAKYCVERIDRELRMAIPNTVRLATKTSSEDTLQFAVMRSSAYYNDNTTANNIIKVPTETITNSDVVIGDSISVYNTNASNFYNGAKLYQVTNLGGDTVTLHKTVAPHSPYDRFFVVDTPVTFYHDAVTKRVYRRFGYGISNSEYGNTGGEILATHVDQLKFTYLPGLLHRNGSVNIDIVMKDVQADLELSFSHKVHLRNLP